MLTLLIINLGYLQKKLNQSLKYMIDLINKVSNAINNFDLKEETAVNKQSNTLSE